MGGGSVGVVAGNPFLRFRVEFLTRYNDTFPNNLIVFGSVFLLQKRLLRAKSGVFGSVFLLWKRLLRAKSGIFCLN